MYREDDPLDSTNPTDSPPEPVENFTLPPNQFVQCLPDKYPHVKKNRLLEYWEKNILPKMHDYCKGTLK